MRCLACDVALKDREATRKSILTGEYLDLCNRCYNTIKDDIDVVDSPFHDEPDTEVEVIDDLIPPEAIETEGERS